MSKLILEAITDGLLIALPIDLLYLYFAGGWGEPVIWWRYTELAILFAIPFFGIYRIYRYLK